MELECISKGKTHKRYKFSCKFSLATLSKDNWNIVIQANHVNPSDGRRFKADLAEGERLTSKLVKEAYMDLGLAKMARSLKRWLKRRSVIKPMIGYI